MKALWYSVQLLKKNAFVREAEASLSVTHTLEMIHFTGDIYENCVPQHLLPF